jgi:hypothetical protein
MHLRKEMIVKKNEAQSITGLLKELFKTHGFESEEHDGWIIPKGSDYAMKGYWYPNATETTGQLTIEVFINSEMIMVESFAGLGESEVEKLKNAFSSFIHHAFTVLLLSIWNRKSTSIVMERWTIGSELYEVYIGTQGVVNYDKSKKLELPRTYSEKIKALVSDEVLNKPFHWFTFFYANLNGLDTASEVLKDNIRWIDAEKGLSSLSWKRSNHYYAVRQFLVLKKI